jgi:hypothetical protein
MAPKSRPKPARFVFTVGMVLAMALTILTITADRDLAALSASPIYHPPVEAPALPRPHWLRSFQIRHA